MKNARKSGMPANMPQMPSMADPHRNDDEYDGPNVCRYHGPHRHLSGIQALTAERWQSAVLSRNRNFDAAAMMAPVKTNPEQKTTDTRSPRNS